VILDASGRGSSLNKGDLPNKAKRGRDGSNENKGETGGEIGRN